MHWMNQKQIEDINKKIVLSRIEDLNLNEYDLRVDSDGDLIMSVEDPKSDGLASIFINLTKGVVEEVNTGIVRHKGRSYSSADESYEDCLNYSRRIADLASIERELQI